MDIVDPATERYAVDHTSPLPAELQPVADTTLSEMAAPEMMGGPAETRLLELLVVTTQARVALEVGTFTGLTALVLARAIGPGGRVITIEVDPETAAIARANFDASPYADRIELIVGDAKAAIADLPGPFDVVWIDAWKPDYPGYYEAVLGKLAPHGVIAADNVLQGGRVADPGDRDEQVAAVRAFNDHVLADPRTTSTVLTVGDGVMLAWAAVASR